MDGEQHCNTLTDQPCPEPRGQSNENTHKAVTEWGRPSRTDEVHRSAHASRHAPRGGSPADGDSIDSNTETQRFLGGMGNREFSGQIGFGKIVGTVGGEPERPDPGCPRGRVQVGCRDAWRQRYRPHGQGRNEAAAFLFWTRLERVP